MTGEHEVSNSNISEHLLQRDMERKPTSAPPNGAVSDTLTYTGLNVFGEEFIRFDDKGEISEVQRYGFLF